MAQPQTAADCIQRLVVDSSLLESFGSQLKLGHGCFSPFLVLDHTLRLQRTRSSVSGSSSWPFIRLSCCLHAKAPWEVSLASSFVVCSWFAIVLYVNRVMWSICRHTGICVGCLPTLIFIDWLQLYVHWFKLLCYWQMCDWLIDSHVTGCMLFCTVPLAHVCLFSCCRVWRD